MYCIKCGVKLDSALKKCPLCGISVPDIGSTTASSGGYSDIYPEKKKECHKGAAITFLVLSVLAIFIILLICRNLYGEMRWAGYPVFGIALFYITFILPLWFKSPNPVIFVPVSHAAVLGYLLFFCLKTGGRWFVPFALPVTLMSCLLSTAVIALIRYVKGGKLFIFGGSIILGGIFSMLVELFQHITFFTPMFSWSVYSLSCCFVFGMFLILAGIIRPLREYLERKFFF